MKKIAVFTLLIFFLSVENSFAWGPMTHTYFAFEILRAASLLPVALHALLTAYSTNFIYGSVVADTFLGKRGQKNPHDWETGFALLHHAKKSPDSAFAYGFLAHLAADTVAHGQMDLGAKSKLGHAWVELESDSLVAKQCWPTAARLDKGQIESNDRLTRKVIDPKDCRSKSFQNIYRMYIQMSVLNRRRITQFHPGDFYPYHQLSIQRAIDVLSMQDSSRCVRFTPNINKKNTLSTALKNLFTC